MKYDSMNFWWEPIIIIMLLAPPIYVHKIRKRSSKSSLPEVAWQPTTVQHVYAFVRSLTWTKSMCLSIVFNGKQNKIETNVATTRIFPRLLKRIWIIVSRCVKVIFQGVEHPLQWHWMTSFWNCCYIFNKSRCMPPLGLQHATPMHIHLILLTNLLLTLLWSSHQTELFHTSPQNY